MNKQPVYYMQTDSRWKNEPYQTTGETATVGGSGCGPSCAAMLIETLTGETFTPLDACNWSMEHGYKALNQGTYYSYFVPQFKAFDIACQQVNSSNLYGNSTSSIHEQVFDMVKEGYYAIACMGKGNWTSSGHFIVIWWEDNKVRINDPASTKDARINGDISTFRSQVKYYWVIDAREYNNEEIEIEEMDATGTVNTTTLNVRSGPGTGYSSIDTLSKGATVTIVGSYSGWYKISYSGSDAWVSASYITDIVTNKTTTTTDEEDDDVVRYNKLSDIPTTSNFRNIVDDLMTAGIIGGDGSDPDGNDDVIDLSHDMVRMLVFEYRAGVYDEAIEEAGLDPDQYKP